MAISKNSFSGPFKGKLGKMVFYILNGQQVCRTIGRQSKPSKKQLANQQAMAATMKVLKPLKDFIKPGFELQAKGTVWNSFNLATAYTKKHALQGEYPNISVDYNKLLLSSGTLPASNEISIVKTEKGVLLTWDNKNLLPGAWPDDLVMVVIYHPLAEEASVHLNAAKRQDGSCFIPVASQLLAEPIETFLCFKSADGERISDSVYVGNLNGAAETSEEKKQKEKYQVLKSHFDKIAASYLKQQQAYFKSGTKTKAFRHLEKEYQVLKNQLLNLPGKPD